MPQINENPAPRRRSPVAQGMLIAGAAVTSLIAAAFLALGAGALWGNALKDDDGYLNTGKGEFATSAHALKTQSLDLDLEGAEEVFEASDLGNVRVTAEPESGKPLFIGIARAGDAATYLRDVSHATVTDVDAVPFEASYRNEGGERKPVAPAKRSIWAASTQGSGTQSVNWDMQDGKWSVVVMNADGSPGVRADVSAGAKVPFLAGLGGSLLGAGAILLVGAAVLLVLAVRPPRAPRDGGGAAGVQVSPVAS